ncbi:MAG: NFACT family protein [Chloroflexi bacterium]|nr:NFACT family protein [Chloroflexota bacterium]MCY3939060.1 NFACT family protein [Chloroflexota bacterium]
MSFDTLAVTALRQDLETAVVGGRVQKVRLIGELSVGLEIYARGRTCRLCIRASNNAPHALLSSKPLRRTTDRETPLLQLLRKYVRGGRVVAVSQPPLERVIVLQISSNPERSGGSRRVELVAELTGRHSNVVLVDEAGFVMDAMKRVGGSVNRYRSTLPKRPYVPPPPLGRPHPSEVTAGDLGAAAASRSDEPAWRVLVGCSAGVSPLAAREALYRSVGRTDLKASEVAKWHGPLRELRDIFSSVESGRAHPVVARENGSPTAYAAYELRQFPDTETVDSISTAIERFHSDSMEGREFASPRADQLRVILTKRRDFHLRRLESLRRALQESEQAAALREKGELLLAYASGVQDGAGSVSLDGSDIRLDPSLTPVENAQAYFKRYRSAQSAERKIPGLMRQAELQAEFVGQALVDLELAESESELAGLERVFAEAGLLDSRKQRPRETARVRPRSFQVEGWQVLLGRSAAQNEHLTFKIAGPDDIWIHARGTPGAHVVVRSRGANAPESVVRSAARLAAGFSGARLDTSVDVDVTRRKFVRRTRGGQPGQVNYRSEQTYRVRPARDIEAD